MVARLTLVASLFQVFDGIQAGAVGAMRGLGKQNVAALITGLGFSATGVTCSYLFCFVAGYGLMGLWYGLFSGILSTAIISVIVLSRTDFGKAVLVPGAAADAHGAYEYLVDPKAADGGVFTLVDAEGEEEEDAAFEF